MTAFARDTFSELYEQLKELDSRIERVTHRVECVYRAQPVCQKLAAVALANKNARVIWALLAHAEEYRPPA